MIDMYKYIRIDTFLLTMVNDSNYIIIYLIQILIYFKKNVYTTATKQCHDHCRIPCYPFQFQKLFVLSNSFYEILLTVTMEIIKTVDDPQGSTETISLSPERQTVPQETMPTGTQLVPLGAKLVPTEARHVSTGAHSMPTEAQLVPTEAQHVSTEAHIMPTEAHIIHTEAQHALTEERRHLFQEIKTEYLETQSMPPKIDIEAPGFIQTERFEKYSEPKVIIRISFC